LTNPKPPNSLKGRKNNKRRVRGIKNPMIMLVGTTLKKWKARYPCNLCMEDHPTHLCPRLAEAQKFITQQQQAVLTNPFQHGKNLTQASASTKGGNQEKLPTSEQSLIREHIYG
jgi:hypothetical protein